MAHRRKKYPRGFREAVDYKAQRLAEAKGIEYPRAFAAVKAQRSVAAATKAAFGDAFGLGYKIPRADAYSDGLHLIVIIEDHILGQIMGHGSGGTGESRAMNLFQQKLERDGYWFDLADSGTMHIRTQGSESMAIRRMDLRRAQRGMNGFGRCTC